MRLIVWFDSLRFNPLIVTGRDRLISESLPTPHALCHALSASKEQLQFIGKARCQLRRALSGEDPRLILIIGPCSIHDITAALEYATKLQRLARDVASHFFIVMRVYFEKARTIAGWKGFLYDPFLDGSDAITTGLFHTRQLLLNLAQMQVPSAAEFLDPVAALYFQDLITWGCIGARTTSSQIHRQLAASLPMPVGFKNSTEGEVELAINGVLAASMPHTYLGVTPEGSLAALKASGNKDGHIVLRGGKRGSNYHASAVSEALSALHNAALPQRLLVDCAHGNARPCHKLQKIAFRSIIDQVIAGNDKIRGILVESHINAGSQILGRDPKALRYAVSLTDPCMDWKATEQLILAAAELLAQRTTPLVAAAG